MNHPAPPVRSEPHANPAPPVQGEPVESHARPWRRRLSLLLLATAAALAADAGYLHAKAWLAQHLLANAWQHALASAAPQRPWPWADTHPVARLQVPAHGIDQIVLAGDAGRTLAFGPGWAESSARPGMPGTAVISGHRDTHFAFLRGLAIGDAISLQGTTSGATYRVVETRIADATKESLLPGHHDALLLVTCFPFDAVVPGGPLRYVVRAERVDDATAARMRAITSA